MSAQILHFATHRGMIKVTNHNWRQDPFRKFIRNLFYPISKVRNFLLIVMKYEVGIHVTEI